MNVQATVAPKAPSPPADRVRQVPIAISKTELRQLSAVSNWRSVVHILAEWVAIFAAALLCGRYWNPFSYIAAVVWIGSRQHALMILMHDGAHYRLLRNRTINDWVSEVLLAWPVMATVRSYRRNHFAHHRHLNTPEDPDWVRKRDDPEWAFPQDPLHLVTMLLRDLSGLGAITLIRLIGKLASRDTEVTRRYMLVRYSFYIVILAMFLWYGAGTTLLLYWFVPLFTWLIFIFRIRSIAEHAAINGTTRSFAHTRTTLPTLLERIFISPKNVNYHLEHHLFPSVPFYGLAKLHIILREKPEFRDAHITRSYIGVLRECVTDRRFAFGAGNLNPDRSAVST
jgi:fatty acid desaturase